MLTRLSLPMQLIVVIVGIIFFGNFFNKTAVQFFYTFSVFAITLKSNKKLSNALSLYAKRKKNYLLYT